MINWFKNMRRKQKESDRLLDMCVQDKEIQLKNKAIDLIISCKNTINDTMSKYKITKEDLYAYSGNSKLGEND